MRIIGANGGFTTALEASGLDAEQWQHVTGSYDFNRGEIRLYKDGVLSAELHIGSFKQHTDRYIRMGSRGHGETRLVISPK